MRRQNNQAPLIFPNWARRTTRFFQSKERAKASWRGAAPRGARGGNLAQFGSIYLNLVRDGLDFRHLVEPGEEVLRQLAILEALVELLTDGQGEPGDFAVARHRGPPRAWHCFHAGQW